MRKVINGKVYDTNKSKDIFEFDCFEDRFESLHITNTGRYFIIRENENTGEQTIIALDTKQNAIGYLIEFSQYYALDKYFPNWKEEL